MFTGLIQTMGRITAIRKQGADGRLTILPDRPFSSLVLGESIAVNGACLTVESFSSDHFSAYASKETLSRTNLGGLKQGDMVNLERALAMGDRLGGHLVSGHVDCVARVESVSPSGESVIFRLAFSGEYSPQVIDKGSVALDGISLTVNHSGSHRPASQEGATGQEGAAGTDASGFLEVNIIPATIKETTIAQWSVGRRVNMETDIIGKYVERMLSAWRNADGASGNKGRGGASPKGELSEAFLRKHGF